MKLSVHAGATGESVNIQIQDSSSTVGAGLSGLVYNTASLACYYTWAGTNCTANAVTLATLAAVTSAHSDGGFKEIDATHMKGLYRFDPPDAALVSGKGRVVTFYLYGAANMAPGVFDIDLTGWDNQDANFGGMAYLNETNTDVDELITTIGAAGAGLTAVGDTAGTTTLLGRLTSTRAGYLDNLSGGAVALASGVNATQLAGQTITAAAGVTFPSSVASPTNITAGTITTVTNLTNAPTAGDFTAAMKTSLNNSTPASITGAVGSVTAAVGSVTAGVTVTTNNDKTGYSLTQAFPSNFSSLGITAGGKISEVALVDTLTTYTGNTPQTGDVFSTANTEPASVIASNASLASKIAWLTAQSLNKLTQTATTLTLRNNADNGNISTSTTSDDGTTATRGVFT